MHWSGSRGKRPHLRYAACFGDGFGASRSNVNTVCKYLSGNISRLGYDTFDKKRAVSIREIRAELFKIDAELENSKMIISNLIEAVKKTADPVNHEFITAAEEAKKEASNLESLRIETESKLYKLSEKLPSILQLGQAFGKIGASVSLSGREGIRDIYRQIIRYIRVRRIDTLSRTSRSVQDHRTFRIAIEFNTNELMKFGICDVGELTAMPRWQNLELKITFQIHSNNKRQEIMLLEHGYSVVSDIYKQEKPVAESAAVIDHVGENPVARAIRWKILMADGVSCVKLAKDQGISKSLVSQHMKLLELPAVIIDYLKEPANKEATKKISFRELQRLLLMDHTEAIRRFHARLSGAPLQGNLELQ